MQSPDTNSPQLERRWSASSSNGREVAGRAGETIIAGRRARRRRDPAPVLQGRPATPTATAAPAWSRSRASACWRPSCCRAPDRRHGGAQRTASAPSRRRRWCWSCCSSDMPETRLHARLRARPLGRASSASASRASRRAAQAAADLSHPAIAVNLDACIQCTRCVRACREEQVNDVIGYAFRGAHAEDRVRPGRSDGRVDLRGLRRVRAGLPDRRADAGARRRR